LVINTSVMYPGRLLICYYVLFFSKCTLYSS